MTTPENPLANAQFTRFTDWEGTEEGAEISPDGKFVAFLADREGEFDLWLSQVGTGRFSNLTRDFPPLAASGFIVRKLGFSGDGSAIWFNPADGKPLLLMDLIGGTPRAFLGEGANIPAWSPDGTRLVYVYKSNRDDPMLIADRTGANARQILAPGVLKNNNPVWSPDGQWIYFVRGSEPQDEMNMNVWRLRASGGSPEQLTTQHAAVNFLAPLDTRTLLYVARAEDGSGPWLWALDVERKVARRVPSGVDQYTSVSASRDGRRIVATVANPSASLWRVPLLDRARRRSRRTALPAAGADRSGAGPALRRDVTVLSVSPRDGRRTLEGPGRTGVRSPEGGGRGIVRAARGVAGRTPRRRRRQTRGETAPVDHVGGRHERTAVRPNHRSRRGVRPGHCGLVAGRGMDRRQAARDAQGPGLFKIPVEGAVGPCASSPVKQSIRCGRRTAT